MGNETSTLSPVGAAAAEEGGLALFDAQDGESAVEGGESCAFRVLGIQEQSPAAAAGFVSFFDFILEANGIRLDTKDSTLMELIAQSEDRPLALRVYNVKSQTTRELQLVPSRRWPGKGLLGVTIRFDSFEGAEDQLLHVLHVAPESPAERAGLRPDSDYLLGTPERAFRDPDDLHDEILDAIDGSFQCYVYNTEEDRVRIVSIVPTERWGGDGVLGAEVGHGYLHRLPSACRGTTGASIGFVTLPKDATAATDAYIKPESTDPADDAEQAQSSSTGPVDSETSTGDADGATTSVAASLAEATVAETVKSSDDPSLIASHDEPSTSKSDATETDAATPATTGASASDKAPTSQSRAGKLRYTARTDMRFPISTVEVLAEPYKPV